MGSRRACSLNPTYYKAIFNMKFMMHRDTTETRSVQSADEHHTHLQLWLYSVALAWALTGFPR